MLTRYFTIGIALCILLALFVSETAGAVAACVLFGFMAGNFACSLIYRLPRGKPLLEHKPYCGVCAHPLSEIDLLPVVGALLVKHRCRYCGARIPYSHFWTEVLTGALFAACYLRFGFGQEFLLAAGIGVFLIILACIQTNDNVVQTSPLVIVMILGALWRTYIDHDIFNFIQGGLIGLVAGCIIWRKQIQPVNHVFSIPEGARLLAMAGVVCGGMGIIVFVPLFVLLWIGAKIVVSVMGGKRLPMSVPLAAAVALLLFFNPLTRLFAVS